MLYDFCVLMLHDFWYSFPSNFNLDVNCNSFIYFHHNVFFGIISLINIISLQILYRVILIMISIITNFI